VENIVGALYHIRGGPERRDLKTLVEAMIGYLLDKTCVKEILVDGQRVLVIAGDTPPASASGGPALRLAQNG
jgi:hypothetical protein